MRRARVSAVCPVCAVCAVCAVVVGCWAPSPPAGAPCSATGACPSPLVCSAEMLCEPAGAAADARPPDAAPTCLAQWQAGPPSLTAPVELAELDTTGPELDPWLTADELTIYFARDGDLWGATRAARTDPFSGAMELTALDSPGDDSRVSLTADGEVAILSTVRSQTMSHDLLAAARTGSGIGDWGEPAGSALAAVNTGAAELDPDLSADGHTLYFSVNPGNGGQHHLARTTRDDETSAFAAPSDVTVSGGPPIVGDPSLARDGSILVYSGQASGSATLDLYVGALATPTTVTTLGALSVNSDANDGDGALSTDACRLYFSSDRSGGTGGRDLYVTSVILP